MTPQQNLVATACLSGKATYRATPLPGRKGTIPDLVDMPIVIGVENQLQRKNLKLEERRKLETDSSMAADSAVL